VRGREGGKRKQQTGRKKEKKERERGGRGGTPPLTQIPGSAPGYYENLYSPQMVELRNNK